MAVSTKALDEKQKEVHVAMVVRHGDAITLPENMTLDDAIDVLKRRKKYDDEVVSLNESFDAFPWDGAHALHLALEEKYGWYGQEKTPGFFGDTPPSMISIEVGVNEAGRAITKQVPWGRFSVPAIGSDGGWFATSVDMRNGRMVFALAANLRHKFQQEFHDLAALVRKILREQSIYKGKALAIRFRCDEDTLDIATGKTFKKGQIMPLPHPKFIVGLNLREEDLVFPLDVGAAIATNIYTPIEMKSKLEVAGIPFKRGVLLTGAYGTGKTCVANVTADKCTRNGITFLLCQRADEFAESIRFAQQYAPAVVFCEDIDRVASGDRDVKMDDLLNTIDGIESKRGEIMSVLTTNNVQDIHQSLLRPGRLDAVVWLHEPDAKTVERLVRLYAKGSLDPKADITKVGKLLNGNIPAVIAECVQRAKLAELRRTGGVGSGISSDALVESAETMSMQLELLKPKARANGDAIAAARVFGAAITKGLIQNGAHQHEEAAEEVAA